MERECRRTPKRLSDYTIWLLSREIRMRLRPWSKLNDAQSGNPAEKAMLLARSPKKKMCGIKKKYFPKSSSYNHFKKQPQEQAQQQRPQRQRPQRQQHWQRSQQSQPWRAFRLILRRVGAWIVNYNMERAGYLACWFILYKGFVFCSRRELTTDCNRSRCSKFTEILLIVPLWFAFILQVFGRLLNPVTEIFWRSLPLCDKSMRAWQIIGLLQLNQDVLVQFIVVLTTVIICLRK